MNIVITKEDKVFHQDLVDCFSSHCENIIINFFLLRVKMCPDRRKMRSVDTDLGLIS